MRSVALLALLALLGAGCSAQTSPDPPSSLPPGCGMLPESQVTGLLGDDVTAVAHGSVSRLSSRHEALRCSNTVPGDRLRQVTVTARYHPRPLPLPSRSCTEGWVYAGTPDKYAPACQEAKGDGGTTVLLVRWQPYVMRVTIARPDRSWGGDPETALAMSRALARGLGVQEAAGDG